MNNFDQIKITQKTGNEPLTNYGNDLEIKLIDFWKWSVSDILSNATRGRFAEFIVATALKIDLNVIRDEWAAYDLETQEGIKIEVKSAAYLQSWKQKDFSKISFSIKKSLFWDSETNTYADIAKRQADIYVFCLLKHKDKATINPLELSQWEFYVVSTKEIDNYERSNTSITLNSLQKITKTIKYEELYNAIKLKSQDFEHLLFNKNNIRKVLDFERFVESL